MALFENVTGLLWALCCPAAFPLMTNERKTDSDTQSPEIKKDGSNGDGTEKPGLVIDVVLPKKEVEEPDLGKKH